MAAAAASGVLPSFLTTLIFPFSFGFPAATESFLTASSFLGTFGFNAAGFLASDRGVDDFFVSLGSFLISFLGYLLLVCRNTADIYVLILLPAVILNSFFGSSSFLWIL